MRFASRPGFGPGLMFAGLGVLLLAGVAPCRTAAAASGELTGKPVTLRGQGPRRRTTSMQRGIWISSDEIFALPMTGPAWDALKSRADRPAGTPDLSNQDQNNNVYVLAKALVYARTGIESYRTEVRQNCMAAIDTELDGDELALSRELCAYVVAADLVGLEAAEDSTFRAWLHRTLTEVLAGRTLRSTQEVRPNNWGTMAGASRAAVAVYLGDSTELARTAQVFEGWLGNRAAYAGFDYGSLSWQCNSALPVGINPQGCTKLGESIDGALPEEMRRGCDFVFPPCHTGYPWEALQGVTVQAEILHRQGYDTWNWQNQAIKRSVQFLYDLDVRYGGWWATGDDRWNVWLVNRAYGTSYPAVTPNTPGKNMGWADWTHGSPVPVMPTITSFVPSSALVGATVAVHGSSFGTANDVTFNGVSAAFTIVSDTVLNAVVPAGAASGPVVVTNYTGSVASAQNFTVIVTPTVSFFAPDTGVAGVTVGVHGTGLGTVSGVTFNGTAATFTLDSDTLLHATAPAGVTTGPIIVTNPAGRDTSDRSFTVIARPKVTFFAPDSGAVGAVVGIHGTSLARTSAVSFGGVSGTFTLETDTLLHASVPVGAASGRIVVTNPAGSDTSTQSFTVLVPPSIASFAPDSGIVGDTVTVHGASFATATAVAFNGGAAAFTIASDSLLHAIVPAGSSSGPIEVTNPAGSDTTVQIFTVIAPPNLTFFDPDSAAIGTVIGIHGTSLGTTTGVSFNGGPAAFTIDGDSLLHAAVPAGTGSGPIVVTNVAGSDTSAYGFTVIDPPTVTFFAPDSGAVGTIVGVHGVSLATATAVTFNGDPATFTIDGDSLLLATVPAGAGSGPIAVTNLAGSDTTSNSFTVIAPPTVTFFAPDSGVVGTLVAIHGASFTTATGVSIGGGAAAFTIDGDSLLHATIPAAASSGPIAVTNPAGTATSVATYHVIGAPTVTFLSPDSGAAGATVAIHGTSFTTATAVSFNGTAAAFTLVSDSLVDTAVPAGASSGPIAVTNLAGTGTSASVFVVIGPPSIASFAPASGPVGAAVDVHGAGLGRASAVTFNGAGAPFTLVSDSLLHTTVPAGAASGPIAVTNPAGTGTSAASFTVIAPPTITFFTPDSGQANTVVTVHGTSFTTATAVRFSGTSAAFTTASDTLIHTRVPAGAATGPIAVTNPAGSDTTDQSFVVIVPAPVGVVDNGVIVRQFALRPCYPNPFQTRTHVRFDLPRAERVRLVVYDLMGRVVRTLVDGDESAGEHEVVWDARDDAGSSVDSGVYWLRFEAHNFTSTRRVARVH